MRAKLACLFKALNLLSKLLRLERFPEQEVFIFQVDIALCSSDLEALRTRTCAPTIKIIRPIGLVWVNSL